MRSTGEPSPPAGIASGLDPRTAARRFLHRPHGLLRWPPPREKLGKALPPLPDKRTQYPLPDCFARSVLLGQCKGQQAQCIGGQLLLQQVLLALRRSIRRCAERNRLVKGGLEEDRNKGLVRQGILERKASERGEEVPASGTRRRIWSITSREGAQGVCCSPRCRHFQFKRGAAIQQPGFRAAVVQRLKVPGNLRVEESQAMSGDGPPRSIIWQQAPGHPIAQEKAAKGAPRAALR